MADLAEFLGIAAETLLSLVWTASIVLVYVLARAILRRVALLGVDDSARRYSISKAIGNLLGILLLVALALVWTRGGAGIAAYLGIVSAGLAIALQDPLINLAGFLFIVLRKPFAVGDRVQIGEVAGDVIDVRIFAFSLIEIGNWVDADQSTGRIIHVPNGWLFRKATANYTQGFNFIWDEVPVTITFESDWRKAKAILEGLARDHSAVPSERAATQVRQASARYMVQYQHLTPIVWTSVADIGVTLTMRYLCEARRRRSTSAGLWEAVLDAFAQHDDIDFAYPTTRFYDNRAEGKPGAGGSAPGG